MVLAAPFPLRLASSLNNLFEGREGSIKTKESGFSFRNSERIETKQAWLSHDPKPLLNPQPPTPKLCATCSRCLTSLLYKRERGVREISSTSRRGLLCSRKEGEGERERRVSLSPLDDGAGERGLSRQRKNKKAHERRRRPARVGSSPSFFSHALFSTPGGPAAEAEAGELPPPPPNPPVASSDPDAGGAGLYLPLDDGDDDVPPPPLPSHDAGMIFAIFLRNLFSFTCCLCLSVAACLAS